MRFSRRKTAIFASGLLALAVIAGVWAFFTANSSIRNVAHTSSYGTKTIEEFTPEQKLEPGGEIKKKVGVSNTGDYPLAVRIKMTESWARSGIEFIGFASSAAGFNSVAVTKDGMGNILTSDATQAGEPAGKTDGLTAGDESVMYKNLDLTGWSDGGDGYWYYSTLLAPGQSTGELLKSLVLADDTDMGKYTHTEYWSTVAKDDPTLLAKKVAYDAAVAALAVGTGNQAQVDSALTDLDGAYGWVTVKPLDDSTITFRKAETAIDPAAGGYSDADYTLTIATEVCQATKDAIDSEWTVPAPPPAVMSGWGF